MLLVSFVFQHYMSLPYQKFTEKIIAALALFQVIQRTTEDEEQRNTLENDELEVLWIERNTHRDLLIPIYILDRCVNPTKGEFKLSQNKVTFDTNIKGDDGETFKQISLTENQMQEFLCLAIRRVNDIIMRNMKVYCEEMPIPDLGVMREEPGFSFKDV